MAQKNLNFNRIIGQNLALNYLNFFIKHPNRLPTLSIFYGPEGTGKLSVAESFCKQLLCHENLESLSSCSCPSCNLFYQKQHPDYIFFKDNDKPVLIGDEKKPEDFTIRWLVQSKLNFKPHFKKMRIICFSNASLITNEAETALLKTLEEPRTDTKFIFIVSHLNKLKSTILSRGIKIKFSYFSIENIKKIYSQDQKTYYPFQGGSLDYSNQIDEIKEEIWSLVKKSIKNPILMLKLEFWLSEISKTCEQKYSISYKRLLNYFSLILIYEIYQSSEQEKLKKIKKIFFFKKKINTSIAGLEPYLLSYLFYQLNKRE